MRSGDRFLRPLVAAVARPWTSALTSNADTTPYTTFLLSRLQPCYRLSMKHSHLPRLDQARYKGFAFVHWTFTVRQRKTGWLDENFHASFRETLIHGLARYLAICPIYCLMPDHAHLLILGGSLDCDQRQLTRFLRRHTNNVLKSGTPPCEWQKQPHDNILREEDRARNAFQKVAHYISENPARAGLTEMAEPWPYCDAIVPGYPELRFHDDQFWESFWRIYASKLPADYRPPIDRRSK